MFHYFVSDLQNLGLLTDVSLDLRIDIADQNAVIFSGCRHFRQPVHESMLNAVFSGHDSVLWIFLRLVESCHFRSPIQTGF